MRRMLAGRLCKTGTTTGLRQCSVAHTDVTVASSDVVPSSVTFCVRSARKSPIHDSRGPRTPQCFSFSSRRLCSTLSKAFEKSSSTAPICCWSRSPCARSCTVRSSWVSHDRSFLKPNCLSVRMPLLSRCCMTWLWMMCSIILL